MLSAPTMLAVAAKSADSFHIGPWIIVPILIIAAIIVTPIYIVRDQRKRRAQQRTP